MNRFIALFVCVVSLVEAHDIESCSHAAMIGRHCCKFNVTDDKKAIMNECFEVAEPHTCAFETCYGQKRGFVMTNGTVNQTALINEINMEFENATEVGNILKKKCLGGDTDFSQEDSCYLREIRHCMGFYSILNCQKWNEDEECKKIKTTMEDCKKILT